MMPANQLDQYVCFNFYNGWRTIQRFYKDALGKEISAQQSYVLELCDKETGISMTHISDEMRLDKSAVSTLIARMEKNGLVMRIYDPTDRRAVNVVLTDKGEETRADIREKMIALDKKLYSNLTEEEVDTLKRIVRKLSGKVDINEL